MGDGSVRAVLSENLAAVRGRVGEACTRAGRDPGEVTLVVVTKTVEPEVIETLADLGVREVGENRVQALVHRAGRLGHRDLNWHMIGHLQRNKVRKVLPVASLIQSVESLRLARAIDRVAGELGRSAEVLLEVNISGEEAKFGLTPDGARDLVQQAPEWPHLRILGLMTMPPLVDDPETVRPIFVGLRDLRDSLAAEAPPEVRMQHLSMGMTQDYVQAVEEGATIVRVGTAIFGGLP